MAWSRSQFWLTGGLFLLIATLLYEALPLFSSGGGRGNGQDLVNLAGDRATSRGAYAASYGLGTHWHGWPAVDHLFIFGDSWTTTGFEVDLPQPTVENPWGNPEWDPADWHLGAGNNWVGFFTAWHNESLLRTVNLAYGGATIDMELIHPFESIPAGMRDLGYQVNTLFEPNYASHPEYFDWTSDNSLFIIWLGLNDIHNANAKNSHNFGMVWDRYAEHVEHLYQMDARNFMFINIPPIERAPLAAIENMVEDWGNWVNAWNHNLTVMADTLTTKYPDATAYVFDVNLLFTDVMDDPCSHEATCAFKDTTKSCGMYAFGTPDFDTKRPECEFRVDEYLWMNDIHPTTRMHNLTSLTMAQSLMVE